jgi:hypothetical protein
VRVSKSYQARLSWLHNLDTMPKATKRTNSISSLREAIAVSREVLRSVSDDHRTRSSFPACIFNEVDREPGSRYSPEDIKSRDLNAASEMTRQAIGFISLKVPSISLSK